MVVARITFVDVRMDGQDQTVVKRYILLAQIIVLGMVYVKGVRVSVIKVSKVLDVKSLRRAPATAQGMENVT